MHSLNAKFSPDEGNLNFDRIRDLSDSEVEEYLSRKRVYSRLKNRLSLLYINDLNFADLEKYREETVATENPRSVRLFELNRLFMNYLASAYALREHLKVNIKRDFGRRSEQADNYSRFLIAMDETHRSYAFYQDFRNFVQHCGFPVGNANYNKNREGTTLELSYSRERLLEDYNRWDKSKLAKWSDDRIDLAEITIEHHSIVKREFPVMILGIYGGNVDDSESYFQAFHSEARAVDETAVAVMMLDQDISSEGGNLVFEDIPINPLWELGLRRSDQ